MKKNYSPRSQKKFTWSRFWGEKQAQQVFWIAVVMITLFLASFAIIVKIVIKIVIHDVEGVHRHRPTASARSPLVLIQSNVKGSGMCTKQPMYVIKTLLALVVLCEAAGGWEMMSNEVPLRYCHCYTWNAGSLRSISKRAALEMAEQRCEEQRERDLDARDRFFAKYLQLLFLYKVYIHTRIEKKKNSERQIETQLTCFSSSSLLIFLKLAKWTWHWF